MPRSVVASGVVSDASTDFSDVEELLEPEEIEIRDRVRAFCAKEVTARAGDHRPLGDQRAETHPLTLVAGSPEATSLTEVVCTHWGQAVRPAPTRAHFCDPHTWTMAPQTASSTSPSSSVGGRCASTACHG
jgi:hypothetical protein